MPDLKTKIANNDATVTVVGMGYVGLPLALNFAKAGLRTFGLDIDPQKVATLNRGESYIEHIDAARIAAVRDGGNFEATVDFSCVADSDAVVICVPTPLTKHHEPDLSYVVSTVESIVPHLKAGQLVSLESTTYPGTTDEELLPRIEKQGLKVGKDCFLVFSPEREDPGNPDFSNTTIPKVIGGVTPACLEAGCALYDKVCDQVVPVSSARAAEFTKLLENIYRSVNIGLVNEMKIVADRMDVDIWEVVQAAATKPFGFTPFYPGPGLGGHCIPIDPFYLTWKAREYNIHTRFIELAGEINESMPQYVVHKVTETLNQKSKALRGSKILIMGLAYKSNVDDVRESASFKLMDLLSEQGAEIDYFDPHVPTVPPTREHARWTGRKSIEWTQQNASSYDCVLIATAHGEYNLEEIVTWCDTLVDTRNILANHKTKPGQVTKA
jgi:UDP-N-acetyl-D-glucosamine dehydrogenase